ncbi:hypothetical protein Gohar_013889, partial [Gossypium harknessii]|nr:hypothetical protein [Gossypium harknessii]
QQFWKPATSIFDFFGRIWLDWKVVLLGYGCEFLFGVVIGHVVVKKKLDQFANTSSKFPARRRRMHKNGLEQYWISYFDEEYDSTISGLKFLIYLLEGM